MTGYAAPLTEMRFALDAIAGLGEIAALPGFEAAASRETVDAILDEAAKFAGGVLAPLNAVGDRERSRLENGVVRTPTGFKAAYDAFVAGGWNALAMPEEHGGQGLPLALGIAVLEMWTSANLAFSLCPMLTAGAVELLAAYGTDEQRRLYLAKLVSGEWTGTMNLTEPQAGSDLGARAHARGAAMASIIASPARRSSSPMASMISRRTSSTLVLARIAERAAGSKGLSLFLVPKFLVNADGSLGAAQRHPLPQARSRSSASMRARPACSPTAIMAARSAR